MYKVEEVESRIRLNANEINIPLSDAVIDDILSEMNLAGFNRYPESDSQSLIKAYADYMKIDEDEVIAGNGSDEILDILFKAFTSYGDKVMSIAPSFVMYELVSQVYRCAFVPYQLKDYNSFDTDDFIEVLQKEKPRMVFICNPNNPTGLLIPKADLIKIVESTDAMIILDEAYGEFISDTFRDYSMIDERRNYRNLIVLKTLSKAYGLAGLRVGFGIAGKEQVAAMAEKKYPYNVSLFSQQFALGLINRASLPFFKERIQTTIENRRYFVEALKAFETITVFPSAANFVWLYAPTVDLKALSDAAGILIRVFTTDQLKGYCRISIGTKDEMDAMLDAIKEGLS
ncbi:histidinol-phosphate transaminase [Fusibacter paucivorans]|uniref:Histidinol-phosphate transaminase n=1 Tax=Fusibacter paucivorans TaxID=76009 RepID=A0ABS5PM11_9FIRM|nr:histidinol-phosphate transaminase [Fusibacter paucivorans]MBS7526091.1 histidinol-phosphate transaminase [Fusibacter paucivorans]